MNEELDFIIDSTNELMQNAITHLEKEFRNIRAGKATPAMLGGVTVEYYGSQTPLSQVANVSTMDAHTITVQPWEKKMLHEIEKAIMKSDLGLNPTTAGTVIRIPLPALTEETRKNYGKQAKAEAENSRVSIRNIRRDILSELKDLLKEKEISEDEERKAHDDIQKITDRFVGSVDEALSVKEKDLMEI